MEPISLGKAIAENGVPIITAMVMILVCWLVKHMVNEQSEDREYYRGIVTHELKDLANASLKNAELNNIGNEILKNHSKLTETFSVKMIESLAIVAERLNGGTAGTKAIARLKEIEIKDRRKKVLKVVKERRK